MTDIDSVGEIDPAEVDQLDPTDPRLAAQPEDADPESLAGDPVSENPLILAHQAMLEPDQADDDTTDQPAAGA